MDSSVSATPVTLKDMLNRSVQRRGDQVALRHKLNNAWQTVTYSALAQRVAQVAEILAAHGIKPGDKVAILRDNSCEWPETYFGIVGIGATAVPVDAKLLEAETAHILRDSGARMLFTDAAHYALVRGLAHSLEPMQTILVKGLGRDEQDRRERIRFTDYDAAMADARAVALAPTAAYARWHPTADTVASFIYTSGTTGRQKGAMLTHGNFLTNVSGCCEAVNVLDSDSFLLVLPLHHAFAFTTNLLLPIFRGCEINFVESLRTVGENVRETQPTIIIGVPLLLEKMYARIMAGLRANKVAHTLFRIGLRGPVVKGIRAKLGGRLRIFVTGGAACDPAIIRGFARLGIPVMEGYGLTETAPVLTLNPLGAPKPGTVGKPIPGVELAILDQGNDGIGEIAARGPNIMLGYYRQDEATAAVMRDGWFLTGDLGFLDEDGYLTITGRKKDLIVNREGKNIFPGEVETRILNSPFIAEALVLAYQEPHDNVGERLGAIVVPHQEALDAHASKHHAQLTDAAVATLLRAEVKRLSSELAAYKRPRRIQIRNEEFEKTSTGKIKRYLYALDVLPIEEG